RSGLDAPDELPLRAGQARHLRPPRRTADARASRQGRAAARRDPRGIARRRAHGRRARGSTTGRRAPEGRRQMTEGRGGGDRGASAVLSVASVLHAALLAYAFPWKLFAERRPVFEYDYALHAYQVDRALSAFQSHGRLFSYDPFVLAGQPAGAVEDLTS